MSLPEHHFWAEMKEGNGDYHIFRLFLVWIATVVTARMDHPHNSVLEQLQPPKLHNQPKHFILFQQMMGNNSNTNLMLSDSDDKRLADAEEQLLLQVIQLFRLHRNSSRLFKLHKKRVNWTEHVNALIDSKEFTKTHHMPYSAFVFLVDILWEDVFVDQA